MLAETTDADGVADRAVDQLLNQPGSVPRVSGHDTYDLIVKGASHLCASHLVVLWIVRGDLLEAVAAAGDRAPGHAWSGAVVPTAVAGRLLSAPPALGLARLVSACDWPAPSGASDRDVLLVPLHDDDARLRGLLCLEVPDGDWRADLSARGVVGEFVQHVSQAVVLGVEREALNEQVRLADAARRVVRDALGVRSLDRILATCYPALVESFHAQGIWIQTFDEHGLGLRTVRGAGGEEIQLPPELVDIAYRAAHRLHATGQVSVSSFREGRGEISVDDGVVVFHLMEQMGFATVLLVPLGAGGHCLGNMVLARTDPECEWTATEREAALDIGHDLGNALLLVRTYEREHVLVRRLQELDDYRTEMIATVAHELKNPLTAVLGHLEILASDDTLPALAQRSVGAMERGAGRLTEIVDDLLLLSRITDPDTPVDALEVDLHGTVDDVVALVSTSAHARGLTIEVRVPDGPVPVQGDPRELDRLLLNLVSNAVKYSHPGGRVTVSLAWQADEVELACVDEGLGISADDQTRLFTEFFRSSNPAAASQPGTGLGLSICRRIVERHGGRIVVESELGVGSAFRVLLPTAAR